MKPDEVLSFLQRRRGGTTSPQQIAIELLISIGVSARHIDAKMIEEAIAAQDQLLTVLSNIKMRHT